LFALRQWFFQHALDGVASHQHAVDFVLVEQLLELAVGNRLDLRVAQPQVLHEHHAKECREYVPGRKMLLALLGLFAPAVWPFLLRGLLLVPEQVQQTPREGGRRILGRLVEHMGLRSPRPRRLSERKLPAAIAAMPDYATAIPRRPFPARA